MSTAFTRFERALGVYAPVVAAPGARTDVQSLQEFHQYNTLRASDKLKMVDYAESCWTMMHKHIQLEFDRSAETSSHPCEALDMDPEDKILACWVEHYEAIMGVDHETHTSVEELLLSTYLMLLVCREPNIFFNMVKAPKTHECDIVNVCARMQLACMRHTPELQQTGRYDIRDLARQTAYVVIVLMNLMRMINKHPPLKPGESEDDDHNDKIAPNDPVLRQQIQASKLVSKRLLDQRIAEKKTMMAMDMLNQNKEEAAQSVTTQQQQYYDRQLELQDPTARFYHKAKRAFYDRHSLMWKGPDQITQEERKVLELEELAAREIESKKDEHADVHNPLETRENRGALFNIHPLDPKQGMSQLFSRLFFRLMRDKSIYALYPPYVPPIRLHAESRLEEAMSTLFVSYPQELLQEHITRLSANLFKWVQEDASKAEYEQAWTNACKDLYLSFLLPSAAAQQRHLYTGTTSIERLSSQDMLQNDLGDNTASSLAEQVDVPHHEMRQLPRQHQYRQASVLLHMQDRLSAATHHSFRLMRDAWVSLDGVETHQQIMEKLEFHTEMHAYRVPLMVAGLGQHHNYLHIQYNRNKGLWRKIDGDLVDLLAAWVLQLTQAPYNWMEHVHQSSLRETLEPFFNMK
jgi:hypothetical protein